MKLLILTCLVAAALALPRAHRRNAVSSQTQQENSSSEEQEIVKQPKYLSLNEEFVNNLNRQRELLTEQDNEIKITMDSSAEEQAMASAQEDSSSSSSSSEESKDAIPSATEQKNIANKEILNRCTLEQLQRQIKYSQLLQEHPYRMNAYSQVQMRHPMSVVDQAQFSVQSFPQLSQYGAYPLWLYFPQDMQYLTPEAVLNTFKPIAPKDAENTNVW
ncbi:casein alpha s1, isoform CRA_b [Rattus norvegicus]|uniref:Alpha-S1-casein n=1 Tax=Rattus norvegicus TaxID=10116 RepID=A6KU21_RAT|nr:casein alpha s1, isoform CRA_b [Rattus norvegicus]